MDADFYRAAADDARKEAKERGEWTPPARARRERGWWGMACWNVLSDAQQARLVEHGSLPFGYEPDGDGCGRGAQVAVETDADDAPGPRFYCLPCAVAYLALRYCDEASLAVEALAAGITVEDFDEVAVAGRVGPVEEPDTAAGERVDERPARSGVDDRR